MAGLVKDCFTSKAARLNGTRTNYLHLWARRHHSEAHHSIPCNRPESALFSWKDYRSTTAGESNNLFQATNNSPSYISYPTSTPRGPRHTAQGQRWCARNGDANCVPDLQKIEMLSWIVTWPTPSVVTSWLKRIRLPWSGSLCEIKLLQHLGSFSRHPQSWCINTGSLIHSCKSKPVYT